MQQLLAEYFERTGRPELAGEVRALKIVEQSSAALPHNQETTE